MTCFALGFSPETSPARSSAGRFSPANPAAPTFNRLRRERRLVWRKSEQAGFIGFAPVDGRLATLTLGPRVRRKGRSGANRRGRLKVVCLKIGNLYII